MPHLIQLAGSVNAIQAMPEMVKFAVPIPMLMGFLMLILIVQSHLVRKITVQVFPILVKRMLTWMVTGTAVTMTLTMTEEQTHLITVLPLQILDKRMLIMAIRVVEFSNGGYKIRNIFA